ncbi:unnamed protein product [Cuscuta epithymum]|uniref:F-box domain-containing protein n=2 Tax=Cuscuta epithymum TaxID=186058 RepID=A0AAV0FZR2_9ASTE|nr:unnamed protein product [Cuscuta epithymum]
MALPNCDLPGFAVVEILLRLPVKLLLRFRAVSKGWCEFITSPDFARMYLAHQLAGSAPSTHSLLLRESDSRSVTSISTSPVPVSNLEESGEVLFPLSKTALRFPFHLGSDYVNDFRVDGCCNGLVCVSLNHTVNLNASRKIVIWNPATTKYRIIDVPEGAPFEVASSELATWKNITLCGGVSTYLGFGYSPESNDYKLLRVWNMPGFANQRNSFLVWVYAFSAGTWKLISCNFRYLLTGSTPTIVNGCMHWYNSKKIIVFDIGKEEFRKMAVPRTDGSIERQLVCINGCLSLVAFDKHGCSAFEVWVLGDYHNSASWFKRFTVTYASLAPPKLVGCWKNDELLFQNSKNLLSCDLLSGSFECLQSLDSEADATIFNYFETFESVYGRGVRELQTNDSPSMMGYGGPTKAQKSSREKQEKGETQTDGSKKKKDNFLSVGFKLKL